MSFASSSFESRRNFLRVSAGTLAGVLAGATRLLAEEPQPVQMPYNNLSDQDEIELGNALAAKLDRQLPIVNHVLIDAYLGQFVERLAKACKRPTLPYRCVLVNTLEVNAYSIAGGHLYLNRGLVEFVEHENQLVATLAHEIGHVAGYHSANQIMLHYRAAQAFDFLRSNAPKHSEMIDQMVEQLGGLAALLPMLHFSRANEYEADLLGFYEMVRAGYQPSGFLGLFELLDAMEKKAGSTPIPWLSDHPPSADRADRIRREMRLVNVQDGTSEDGLAFRAFKMAMNLLPEPPKPRPQK
jgi:predicted Zn-dependent protease